MRSNNPKLGLEEGAVADSGSRKLTPVASVGGGESEQGETGAPSSAGFIEDPERKYHFECCSEEQCQEWMGALRRARWDVGCGVAWGRGRGRAKPYKHRPLPSPATSSCAGASFSTGMKSRR